MKRLISVFIIVGIAILLYNYNKDRDAKKSAELAISFLEKDKNAGGYFFSSILTKKENITFSTPYSISIAAYALSENSYDKRIDLIVNDYINYLKKIKLSGDLWTFYDEVVNYENLPEELFPPDLDDTANAWLALNSNGVQLDNRNLDKWLNYRLPDGNFYFWLNNTEKKYRAVNQSGTDCAIDPSILLVFKINNKQIENPCRYINSVIANDYYPSCSIYYDNYFIFSYLVARTYKGGVACIEYKVLEDKLSERLDIDSMSPLDMCLAVNALIDIGSTNPKIKKMKSAIVNSQNDDGSWGNYKIFESKHAFFKSQDKDRIFVSNSLTTAICLQALIKSERAAYLND